MSVPSRDTSPTVKLFNAHTATSGPTMLSAEIDRREGRFHIFQLVAAGASEFDIELSLDGTNWGVLDTMAGTDVIKQYQQTLLPFVRVRRIDTSGNEATLIIHSATSTSLES